jgi:hypothetical protein
MTGIITAQRAVVGATTAILPIASARYRSATPTPPAAPAVAPQTRSRGDGEACGRNGTTSRSARRPDDCEVTTIAIVLARRDPTPPRKSAAPYNAAEAIASR